MGRPASLLPVQSAAFYGGLPRPVTASYSTGRSAGLSRPPVAIVVAVVVVAASCLSIAGAASSVGEDRMLIVLRTGPQLPTMLMPHAAELAAHQDLGNPSPQPPGDQGSRPVTLFDRSDASVTSSWLRYAHGLDHVRSASMWQSSFGRFAAQSATEAEDAGSTGELRPASENCDLPVPLILKFLSSPGILQHPIFLAACKAHGGKVVSFVPYDSVLTTVPLCSVHAFLISLESLLEGVLGYDSSHKPSLEKTEAISSAADPGHVPQLAVVAMTDADAVVALQDELRSARFHASCSRSAAAATLAAASSSFSPPSSPSVTTSATAAFTSATATPALQSPPPLLYVDVACVTSLQDALLQRPDVLSIRPHRMKKFFNNAERNILATGNHTLPSPYGQALTGDGELVGVIDSGLDWDSCYMYDPQTLKPFVSRSSAVPPPASATHRKIVSYWSFLDVSTFWDNGEHGSHVGGTVAGDASPFSPVTLAAENGLAPRSRLVFTDIGCNEAAGCSCGTGPGGSAMPCDCDFSTDPTKGRCPQGSLGLPLHWEADLFSYQIASAAKIISNSWGDDVNEYAADTSAAIDSTVYHNPSALILFAAGNAGKQGTVSSESNAKNALVVGASRAGFSSFSYLYSLVTDWSRESADWGIAYAQQILGCTGPSMSRECGFFMSGHFDACLQAAPYCGFGDRTTTCGCVSSHGDLRYRLGELGCQKCVVASLNRNDPNNYSPETLASFSSMGPAEDGRIKPDVAMSGDETVSLYSLLKPTVCGTGARSDMKSLPAHLMGMSGTSMATPAVAASAALLREYLRKYYPNPVGSTTGAHPIGDPSASLMKALLINSAETMIGYYWPSAQAATAQRLLLPYNDPYTQGFGRVRLANILPMEGVSNVTTVVLSDESFAVVQGDSHSFEVDVPSSAYAGGGSGGSEVRITLVWTDPPASGLSLLSLVNDLDLSASVVLLAPSPTAGQAPQKVVHFGNEQYFTELPDRVNNVERIVWKNFPDASIARNLTITVSGFSVATTSQTYSLVVSFGNVTLGWQPEWVTPQSHNGGPSNDHGDASPFGRLSTGVVVGTIVTVVVLTAVGSVLVVLRMRRMRRATDRNGGAASLSGGAPSRRVTTAHVRMVEDLDDAVPPVSTPVMMYPQPGASRQPQQ